LQEIGAVLQNAKCSAHNQVYRNILFTRTIVNVYCTWKLVQIHNNSYHCSYLRRARSLPITIIDIGRANTRPTHMVHPTEKKR
jgi:hypothetical protein